jgi:hypothetical protein
MATTTSTVTINAAFLQEIKEDSLDLRRMLRDAGRLFSPRASSPKPAAGGQASPPTHVSRKQLVELLGELRDQLGLHFALEEAYGYFEDALLPDPHLSRRAEALRGQHRALFLEVCALEEQAEQLLYHEATAGRQRAISAGFRTFYERFLDHESHENDLILEAFADDMSADD